MTQPRCQALTVAYSSKSEKHQCERGARYKYGRNYFCKNHAAMIALGELLDYGFIEALNEADSSSGYVESVDDQANHEASGSEMEGNAQP